MTNYPSTRRCSFRLPTALLNLVDETRAEKTRSKIILDCLKKLVHDLQTEQLPREFVATLVEDKRHQTERTVVYIRVPVIMLDYLQFNSFNLTASIIASINLYLTKTI